ncbi:iron-sulfur cluster-binding domain-containing protein [Pontibacter sp. G13]|uniref:flavin reductase family protein n=1 Tax=Pontibacter sp. G13 TaxID=3074898 RepID=UPI002889BA70|nr:iron-sulfur cluster-binding domain-containing protein [Pontibacter sp. G13]WNJ19969.1 iron-sulfur cluster-binding domain-containing protein [Pontibacter sp. G13]
MLRAYSYPVQQRIQESPDTVSLILSQPLVDRITYTPGQYITLQVELEGVLYYRNYSLSSAPQIDRHLRITVKRKSGGKVSPYLVDEVQVGDELTFLAPTGDFRLETATKNNRHVAFFGGGSGMAPLMSMIRCLLYDEPASRASLIDVHRTQQDLLFHTTLSELLQAFPDRFFVHHFITQPRDSIEFPHQVGRPKDPWLESWWHAQAADRPETVYLCGPTPFMDQVERVLTQVGASPSLFTRESYEADIELETQRIPGGKSHAVTIHVGDHTHHIQVPAGATILDAALSKGISLPYSCKRGTCSTCMSKIVKGHLIMEEPSALLPFEVERGKVLICQARPTDDEVEIRVGW